MAARGTENSQQTRESSLGRGIALRGPEQSIAEEPGEGKVSRDLADSEIVPTGHVLGLVVECKCSRYGMYVYIRMVRAEVTDWPSCRGVGTSPAQTRASDPGGAHQWIEVAHAGQ